MVLTLCTFFALVSATANALQCYENEVVTCGKHDPIFDDVCGVYDDSTTAAREVTCNGDSECGTVTSTQSSAVEELQVILVKQTCLAPTDGCLDREQLERSNPELMQLIVEYEYAGIITESLEACSCDTNFCNSAVNLTGRSVYLLPIIIYTIKLIVLG